MDNRVFDVNGKGYGMFVDTLKLALWQTGGCYETSKDYNVTGYAIDPQKGLILLSWISTSEKNTHKFLTNMTAEEVAPMVYKWLQTEEALAVPPGQWDDDCDHDGHNSMGWRMFVEGWGHVGEYKGSAAICVRPAYMWHGK